MRKYYGVRFFGGNRTCTIGQANKVTGHCSVACSVEVFRTREDRDEWVNNEKISAPCGCDGGERIAATKKECRGYCLGETVASFNEDLDLSEFWRYGG